MAGVALVATLALAGCASQGGQAWEPPADDGVVDQQSSTRGIEERKVKLSDGRTITCITWVDSGYQYENTAAGISCDWPQGTDR